MTAKSVVLRLRLKGRTTKDAMNHGDLLLSGLRYCANKFASLQKFCKARSTVTDGGQNPRGI